MEMIILLALGLLPFLVGGGMNWYIMTYREMVPMYPLIALLFLLVWGVISFVAVRFVKQTGKVVIGLNLIACIDLLLVAFQELVLGQYWLNNVGVWTQYFYLPLLNIGFQLTGWSNCVLCAYAASFVLMAAASYAGCKAGRPEPTDEFI